MNSEEQERKVTLDHMIDEKFVEIYFLAKEEFDIENNSQDEQMLYDLLGNFKEALKEKCKHHFETEEPSDDHPLTKWDEGQMYNITKAEAKMENNAGKPKRYRERYGRTVGGDDSIIGL